MNLLFNLISFYRSMSLFLKAAFGFALLSIILLVSIEFLERNSGSKILPVLLVLLGMTVMAFFAYFHSYIWLAKSSSMKKDSDENSDNGKIEIPTLNDEFIQQSIIVAFNKVIDENYLLENRKARTLEQSDEYRKVTSTDLAGVDNALALAKLRIDFENELRALASNFNVEFSEKPMTISHLVEKLIEDKVLPPESMDPVKQIMYICNMGVHGIEISTEETLKTIKLGNELIDRFRSIVKRQ